jgi:hypothetical protein
MAIFTGTPKKNFSDYQIGQQEEDLQIQIIGLISVWRKGKATLGYKTFKNLDEFFSHFEVISMKSDRSDHPINDARAYMEIQMEALNQMDNRKQQFSKSKS